MSIARRSGARSTATEVEWFSASAFKLHVTFIFGLALAGFASWFEWTRALSGRHEVAWAYAFEWPLFAAFGTYLWWRLLHTEPSGQAAPRPAVRRELPAPVDPELAAWEAYLARLHAADPPGGPPVKEQA